MCDTTDQSAASAHIASAETTPVDTFVQPLPLLLQTIGSYSTTDSIEFFHSLVPYLVQVFVPASSTLWHQHDQTNGLYLIESGSLRATYAYDVHRSWIQETMVAGTIAGDLSTLSDTMRNATVVAERDCVLWKLDRENLKRLEEEEPEVARRFIEIVLKGESLESRTL